MLVRAVQFFLVEDQIFFWDWRKEAVACLEESHMDDVTQVQLIHHQQNKLFSASVDGLMCIFDTSGSINGDDHLDSVINVGTSIRKSRVLRRSMPNSLGRDTLKR